ncbi:transposase [Sphingomonas sp. PB1R3]
MARSVRNGRPGRAQVAARAVDGVAGRQRQHGEQGGTQSDLLGHGDLLFQKGCSGPDTSGRRGYSAQAAAHGRRCAKGGGTGTDQQREHQNERGLGCRTGMVGPMVLDGPIKRDAFVGYVRQVLVPDLSPDDIVIMDNLSSHKAPAARDAIEAACATLLFLSPYSSDFNPIEQAFSKLKAQLRKAAERTIHGLWDAISCILDL